MSNWPELISDWQRRYGIKIRKRASEELLSAFEQKHGQLASELKALLRVTNGFSREWFRVLPIKDEADVRDTWDDLDRANEPQISKFLSRDPELFKRFFVFGDMGGTRCTAFERSNGTIWFEEDNEMVQTDLDLKEFIELSLTEVKEL